MRKIKFLCLNEHYAMKEYVEVDEEIQIFLTRH
jgi:hypothetical protein